MSKSDDVCSEQEKKSDAAARGKFYCGSRLPQYFSAFAVNLAVMSVGTVFSWPATAIPYINDMDSNFPPLTPRQVAWITSASQLGGLLICPLMGFLIQKLGLRRSMLVLSLPLLIGWILLIFPSNFWMLVAGRFVTGLCSGGMSVAIPAFLAETSIAEIRGLLGFIFEIMCSVGELYIYVVGYFVSWEWQSLACALIPVLFCVLMLFVPESPRDLILRGKNEEAQKSLAWFRGAASLDLVQVEYDSIVQAKKEAELCSVDWRDCFSAAILKPTIMCMIVMFFATANGSTTILAYTVQIFEDADVNDSFLATVLTGVTQVVVACAAALFVDSIGRRVLLIFSAVGMATSLFLLGGYLHWGAELGFTWNLFPVSMVMLYIIIFSVGFGPIPWLLIGEVIPPAAKGYTSAAIIGSYRLATFSFLFVFNDLVALIGQDMSFWVFATASLMGGVFVFFAVPETKQKSLAEIQLLYAKPSPSKLASPPV